MLKCFFDEAIDNFFELKSSLWSEFGCFLGCKFPTISDSFLYILLITIYYFYSISFYWFRAFLKALYSWLDRPDSLKFNFMFKILAEVTLKASTKRTPEFLVSLPLFLCWSHLSYDSADLKLVRSFVSGLTAPIVFMSWFESRLQLTASKSTTRCSLLFDR